MRTTTASALALFLGVVVWGAAPASAKGAKNPCAKADLRLARTGQGDRDGDGISDCRESRLLHTRVDDPDTDHDGLDDGDEMKASSDPHDADTDDDGVEDGQDDTPAVVQKVEALLDAITCPQETPPPTPTPVTTTPGSITALGITASLGATTEFEDTTCADLAAGLTAGDSVFMKIKILEDMLGALSATEVQALAFHHDDGDDDQGEDENDD